MNIIVCVKQVPASNETRLDPVTHTILRDGAAILNPFDAYAVEEALRLREKLGGCEEYGWNIKTVWGVGYKFEVK